MVKGEEVSVFQEEERIKQPKQSGNKSTLLYEQAESHCGYSIIGKSEDGIMSEK